MFQLVSKCFLFVFNFGLNALHIVTPTAGLLKAFKSVLPTLMPALRTSRSVSKPFPYSSQYGKAVDHFIWWVPVSACVFGWKNEQGREEEMKGQVAREETEGKRWNLGALLPPCSQPSILAQGYISLRCCLSGWEFAQCQESHLSFHSTWVTFSHAYIQ